MYIMIGRKTLLALIALAAAALAGTAYATVPDSGGVIHGCYSKPGLLSAGGALRVIDTSTSQACRSNEIALNWSHTGQPGPQGPKGDTGGAGPAGPAGPAGQGFAAYAHVTPGDVFCPPAPNPCNPPTLDHSAGFTGVAKAGNGAYCLTVAAGIDAALPAIVTSEPDNGAATQGYAVPGAPDCPSGNVEVKTGFVTSGGAEGHIDGFTGSSSPVAFAIVLA
jgi:hypothetical protein